MDKYVIKPEVTKNWSFPTPIMGRILEEKFEGQRFDLPQIEKTFSRMGWSKYETRRDFDHLMRLGFVEKLPRKPGLSRLLFGK